MDNDDIKQALTAIAYKKTIPFCHGCYKEAPSGRCLNCWSDDLMRLLPGDGVEYGVEWVIKKIIAEELEPVNTEQMFEEYLSDAYPETTKIGWLEYDTVGALKELDPIAWDQELAAWIDTQTHDDEIFMSFDNDSTYYFRTDVIKMIEQLNYDLGLPEEKDGEEGEKA